MWQTKPLLHLTTALLFWAGLLLPVTGASGAALSIVPTKLQLDGDHPTHSVTLKNNSDETVTVQVETFSWARTENIDDLDATDELIAVPPFFDIAPGQEQIVRVGLRSPVPGMAIEKAYRLVLSEVPTPQPENGLGVQFALRLSLPVFLTPGNASPKPTFRTEMDGDQLRLALYNEGSQHYRVLSLELSDPKTGAVVATSEQPLYVLPGQVRQLVLRPLKPIRSRRISIVAQTTGGNISVVSEIEN